MNSQSNNVAGDASSKESFSDSNCRIRVDGLTFKPFLHRSEIQREVERVAAEIRKDYIGRQPIFLCVLNGAFVFAADLFRSVGITDASISFVRYSSYSGTSTTGSVKQLIGLPADLEGRDIIIIEDIVDTGLTAEKMIADLQKCNPASVKFATLLHKPASSRTGYTPDYIAFSIEPKFIIGYGLDLDGKARNLPDIYVNTEDEESHPGI